MNFGKHLACIFTAAVLAASMIPANVFADDAAEETLFDPTQVEAFDGEVARTTETLYNGVTCTHISLSSKSKYGQNEFWYVVFDPTQEDLALDVTMGGQYANELYTVKKTVEIFNSTNTQNKTAISAINGDLWMVSYAHARVEGKGTSYGGYSDAVVTHSLTLPRGLDIYDGEIISSPHTTAETPYEGEFNSFGITADGRTVLGTPKLVITMDDESTGETGIKITGLNRLPADKAIMVYSDKGCEDNYSLDDAYELIIDCDYDYKITSGCTITGKVTGICKSGDTNEKMKQNRLIVTARGAKYIEKLANVSIGDTVSLSFTLKGTKADNDIWQEVVNAVGGHMPLVKNGKDTNIGDSTNYPTSIIGNYEDGRVIFLTVDGRQKGYSVGFKISDMGEILVKLGVYNAFLLDGGGSATMVNTDGSGNYEIVNQPSDTDENGNAGVARSVVNTIILSYITEPDPTEEPTAEPTEAPEETPSESTAAPAAKSGCGSVLGSGALAGVLALSILLIRKRENDRI